MKTLITADQARRARRELGISQAKLAEESGASLTLIKHFESYRLENPSESFQQSLVDYFTSNGVDLSEHGGDGGNANPSVVKVPRGSIPVPQGVPVPRMSFRVSDSVTDEELDAVLTRMEENDDEIANLMRKATGKGVFGGYTDETILDSQRLFGLMAENYMLFRYLQGRNFLDDVNPGAKEETHGHLVHRAVQDSPLPKVNGSDAPAAADTAAAAKEVQS